jgi:6-phosphogluconolactonase
MTDVKVYLTLPDFYAAAADFIIAAAEKAIKERGRFTIALSGGSTPERVHELLAKPERAQRIDWNRTFVFIGDERFVPPSDKDSNFGMACRSLLDHVPIPAANLHPVPTELDSPEAAAVAYAQTLAEFFQLPLNGTPPQLDVNILGLGDDGHTASLFPGKPTLQVTDRWVVSSPPGTLPPPIDRVTLTFPVLNAAREILMLVTGEKKAATVQDVLENHPDRNKRPSVAIVPSHGTLIWMLDSGAASKLTKR